MHVQKCRPSRNEQAKYRVVGIGHAPPWAEIPVAPRSRA